MSTDQLQTDQDLGQVVGRPRGRDVLNWFGAAFGIAVLVGASFLYLRARTAPAIEAAGTTSPPIPTVTSPIETAHDEPPEPPPVVATSDPVLESTTAALLGLNLVGSLEIHQLEAAYAEASEVSDGDIAQVTQALAALEAVSWPEELTEDAAELRTGVAELLAALESRDVEGVRHGLEEVHNSQHRLWSAAYAWLSGAEMPDHNGAPPVEAEEMQVIEVGMYEFGYEPETIDISAGVPVIFRFTNTGRLPHEAMVGDSHMHEEWAAAADHDDGQEEGHHGDLMATLVQPGETKDLEVLIEEPGTWYVACHLVGHYEEGQIAAINVKG